MSPTKLEIGDMVYCQSGSLGIFGILIYHKAVINCIVGLNALSLDNVTGWDGWDTIL